MVYARFPEDISKRKVLLMYPIMSEYMVILKVKNEQFVYGTLILFGYNLVFKKHQWKFSCSLLLFM